MKISNSKKELARIISENGGWRDGAEFAALEQQGGSVWLCAIKPIWNVGVGVFSFKDHVKTIPGNYKLPNIHQALLSRAEYFHLYPAPDADGWIEWNGGKCPVDKDARIDIRMAGGVTHYDTDTGWGWNADSFKITHYRLHKPEQAKLTAVGDDETDLATKEELEAMELGESPEQRAKLAKIYAPSIEQLMQIHCDRAHALSEKRSELLIVERQELEALDALKVACKEAGFDISPVENPQEKQESELVITDWRDLQVGDVISITSVFSHNSNEGYEHLIGEEAIVAEVGDPSKQELRVKCGNKTKLIDGFTFIRHP